MPEVLLSGLELNGRLPKKCLVCGESCKIRSTTIAYQPMWYLMMFTRVRITRYMNVKVPLCSEHTSYFRRFSWFALAGVGVIVLMMLGVFLSAVLFGAVLNQPGLLCVIVPLGMVLIVATGATIAIVRNVVYYRGVYTDHIANGEMRLHNVSQPFFDELEQQRQERGFYDDDRPRKRPKHLRDDEDDLEVVDD
jgi:hypothetical protein